MQTQGFVRRNLYCSPPKTLALTQRTLDKSLPFHKPILSLLLQHQTQLKDDRPCEISFTPPLPDGGPEILRRVMTEFGLVREYPASLKNILTDILDCKGSKLLVFAGEEKRGRGKALKDWEKKLEWLWSQPRYSAYRNLFSRISNIHEEELGERVTLLTRQGLNKIKPISNQYKLQQDIFLGFDAKKVMKDSWFNFTKDQPELGGGFSAHLISEQDFAGATKISLTSFDLLVETSFSQTEIFQKTCEAIERLLALTQAPIHLRLASPSLALSSMLGEALYQRFYIPKQIRSLDQAVIGRVITPCLSFLSLLNRKAGVSLYVSLQDFPDVHLVLIEPEKK